MAVGTISAQTADGIAKKYVEAIGGASKRKAVKNRRYTISLAQSGVEIPGVILGDNGNRQRLELNFSGMQMVQAYDGTTPWTINQFQGVNEPIKLEGEEAKQLSETQFLDEFIDYKKRGFTISYEGEQTVEGTESYKVKLTKKSGTETFHFFSKESGLQIAQSSMGQGQETMTYFGDYKESEGLKYPSTISVKTGPGPYTITIVKAEYNVEIGDDAFTFPGK